MARKVRKSGKLINGVGTNDANYTITRSVIIGGKLKMLWTCPYYKKWSGMLSRVYNEGCLRDMPCYIGTSVCEEWFSFMAFRKWLMLEIRRVFPDMEESDESWSEYKLDKDLIVKGNKVYSPTTCMLISGRCNMVLGDNAAIRGQYPLGVDFKKRGGRFRARVHTPEGSVSLKSHATPMEAHKAWQIAKKDIIQGILEKDPDVQVKIALQSRVAQLHYEIDNNLETIKL